MTGEGEEIDVERADVMGQVERGLCTIDVDQRPSLVGSRREWSDRVHRAQHV